MYTVIRDFKDKDGRIYRIGDDYPSKGAKKPTNARIKVLSSTDNKYKQIFITKKESE